MTDAEAIQYWEERAREAEHQVKERNRADIRFAVCGASFVACVLIGMIYAFSAAHAYANGVADGQRDGELECLRAQMRHRSEVNP